MVPGSRLEGRVMGLREPGYLWGPLFPLKIQPGPLRSRGEYKPQSSQTLQTCLLPSCLKQVIGLLATTPVGFFLGEMPLSSPSHCPPHCYGDMNQLSVGRKPMVRAEAVQAWGLLLYRLPPPHLPATGLQRREASSKPR